MMNSWSNGYIEYLDWDSQLFNKRICRITSDVLNEVDLRQCIEWAKSENIDCIYYLIDISDVAFVNIAERFGFNFVDFRITLNKLIQSENVLNRDLNSSFFVREANETDLLKIKALARSNHLDSRFFKDHKFDRKKSEELYELWIDKNSKSEFGSIIISEFEHEVAGYIAISYKEKFGTIDLIGVNSGFRNMGIGVNLISDSIEWFRNKNVCSINVVTQGANIPALRMYSKCGFSPIQCKSWYHLWL